jgi:hypothetical protein
VKPSVHDESWFVLELETHVHDLPLAREQDLFPHFATAEIYCGCVEFRRKSSTMPRWPKKTSTVDGKGNRADTQADDTKPLKAALEKKGGLTLSQLANYDDLITDALIDHVSAQTFCTPCR